RRDIDFKGSGRTPFSRGGDGQPASGRRLREPLASEAMHALGIPTTRALAVVGTGAPVYRETPLPGAVLTRVAASHLRVGTFQFFAARAEYDALRRLADYTIRRHDPALADDPDRYLGLLRALAGRQAGLVAQWMNVGFIHGVMNTDNMALSGETIDYGPCAFLEAYDPATVFSSIDEGGRYAFGKQPSIARWNLARFAETLLPLMADPADEADMRQAAERATEVLQDFTTLYEAALLRGQDRKSTRLNSSHVKISYAVFCLKKKKNKIHQQVTHHDVIQKYNKTEKHPQHSPNGLVCHLSITDSQHNLLPKINTPHHRYQSHI